MNRKKVVMLGFAIFLTTLGAVMLVIPPRFTLPIILGIVGYFAYYVVISLLMRLGPAAGDKRQTGLLGLSGRNFGLLLGAIGILGLGYAIATTSSGTMAATFSGVMTAGIHTILSYYKDKRSSPRH